MKTLIATAAAATLVLAACGDDDGDISPQTLTDALVDQGFEQELAECISDNISGQVSSDDFNQIALAQSPDDMTDEQMSLVIDVTTECTLAADE